MSEKQTVKFGDICREVKLTTKDPIADGYERYIGLEHLDSGSLKIKRWGIIEEDNPSFTRVFKKGHILFGKRRPYLKKAAIAEFDGICSGDIIVMEPTGGGIDPEIFPYICQSDDFWEFAVKNSSGSLSPRTKYAYLKNYELSKISVDEQEKCLAIIENISDVLTQIDGMNDSLQSLRNRTLNQLFSDNATAKNEVSGQKIFKIFGGHAPSNITFNEEGDLGYFKVDDFNKNKDHGKIRISSEKFTAAEQEKNIGILKKGFLVFPKRGAAIFKNRVGILDVDGSIDSNLMALECLGVEPNYLRVFLEWFGLHNISDNSGIPQINNKHVYPLLVPTFNDGHRQKIVQFESNISDINGNLDKKRNNLESIVRQITKVFKV
ncbi:hypothetical protein P0E96_002415 [Vibrio metschnikovii]|nr:hypothetical protein [Vibrio metschnikovii]